MGKTKAEEREALVKIGQILKDFGPEDTYIGKAFEGCVEQADENINSDWMMSYKERYDNVSEQLHAANVRLMELAKQLNQKDDAIARLEAMCDDCREDKQSAIRESLGHIREIEKLTRAEEAYKLEIIKLKAKLYDMMTGEEVKG